MINLKGGVLGKGIFFESDELTLSEKIPVSQEIKFNRLILVKNTKLQILE